MTKTKGVPEQTKRALSDRQQSVVDYLIKRGEKYSTRVRVATELEISIHQVSNAITQAQMKGWQIESRHKPNSTIKEYKVAGDATAQGFAITSQTQKQTIHRFVATLNHIRIKAKENNQRDIEKIAHKALVSVGLQVE